MRTLTGHLWWRLLMWSALTVVSVIDAHGTGHRIAAGALMAGGAITLQFVDNDRLLVRRASVLATTAAGLGACFASSGGLAEVLVLVAATRAPDAFAGRGLLAFTVLDTIAFAATIGLISHSLAGVLAGIGIPLLVQRAIEQQELVRERDRAKALLVELQNAREGETQAAALRERGRIAREMHDVLAHSLAGLSVQLQAVRAVAAREGVADVVLDPLDKAAQLARDGLTEARQVVGTLRDPAGLGLDALAALVARQPGEANLTVDGTPGTVSPDAGHAIYRAVQESLTNAARYAPGSPVSVQVSWSGSMLAVRVEDLGPAQGRNPVVGQGTGLGLAGMGERLEQVAGSVRAGPGANGGWQVEMIVPVQDPA